jgi:hypothetical protein
MILREGGRDQGIWQDPQGRSTRRRVKAKRSMKMRHEDRFAEQNRLSELQVSAITGRSRTTLMSLRRYDTPSRIDHLTNIDRGAAERKTIDLRSV